MKGIIFASGLGQRLSPLTNTTNKGMLPVPEDGKPILEHIVDNMMSHGIFEIVFGVGHLKEQVIDYFGDGSRFGARFAYSSSAPGEIPNTAGQLALAREFFEDTDYFLLHYGDALTNLDITAMYAMHKRSGAVVTSPGMNEIWTNSGVYVVSEDGKASRFVEKPFINDLTGFTAKILSNVPVYWLSSEIWHHPNMVIGKDFNADVVEDLVPKGKVAVYEQPGLWHLDIGDIKKYEATCKAYRNGTQAELRKLA